MSAGNDEPRYTPMLRRMLWFALGVGVATLGMIWATLLTTGQASAQPLNVPGIGVVVVPGQVGLRAGIEPDLHPVPAAPQRNSSVAPHGVPPVLRSAVGYAPASGFARPAIAPGTGYSAVAPAPNRGVVCSIPAPVLIPGVVRTAVASASVPDVVRPAVGPTTDFGIVRSAEGVAPASGIVRIGSAPASDLVRSAGGFAPARGIVRIGGAPASGIVRSAVETVPVSAPEQAPVAARTFTFAPAPAPDAVQSAVPGLPPALDIPSVRQFLSAPQFRGLTLPNPALPAPPAQIVPQVRPTPHTTAGQRALAAARSKLGAAYRYGSAGPNAFDCSGLVQWSYRQAGVTLPRTSYGQLDSGTPVPLNQLQPGDLVSFYGGGHSAIYEGNGRVIHAATEGTGVTESPISQMPVTGARRF